MNQATHEVINSVGRFLKKGELVYQDSAIDPCAAGEGAWWQSVNPSYKDGRWFALFSNVKPLPAQLEND